ncbi:hypothetical protein [Haladaptatus cibarius]|uniref:hypothetical protein n=1 Tax=Haladaptatus cibarius TaxID=453847 RepID=UPI000678711B|nr:hypothetical protein [Haladaptatus cibarius]
MKRNGLLTIAVVFIVLLAGCSGFGSSDTTTTETTTTGTSPTEQTATETSDSSTTTTTTTTMTTESDSESWSEPTSPNTPLQNNMDEEDRDEPRIQNIELVDTTEASSGGYSNFNLQINADTVMDNIDPSEHGTVRGEPYFLVYADGSLTNESRFARTDGTLIERTQEVSQDENGEYVIDVRPGGLEEAGADGEVTLLILLMDEDKDWDDIYGVSKITVEYSAEE